MCESSFLHGCYQDPEQVCFDLKYGLRICLEHDHKQACVHIYTTMGLYEEAVDLALQVRGPVGPRWTCEQWIPYNFNV